MKGIISPVDQTLAVSLQEKINNKTKPLGSLGVLEEIALRIGLIQKTLSPSLQQPHMLVFAADHGIAEEGISLYPQEVTWQMVMNFIQGGAAINVFCRQHNIKLHVVDAGVKKDFPAGLDNLIIRKAGHGTHNFAKEPAMQIEQAQRCLETGADIITGLFNKGCNIVGFGEMGIGNTCAASMIASLICNIPVRQCAGRGTGLNDEGVQHKINVLEQALSKHGKPGTPLEILATYGGFEIAQMTGAMLQAAACRMVILVDGFIATAAYLIAQAIEPAIKDYVLFCHQSKEHAHKLVLEYLHARPLLQLDMRLGEGTGAAIAYPLVQSAVSFMNEMASFESAGVSTQTA